MTEIEITRFWSIILRSFEGLIKVLVCDQPNESWWCTFKIFNRTFNLLHRVVQRLSLSLDKVDLTPFKLDQIPIFPLTSLQISKTNFQIDEILKKTKSQKYRVFKDAGLNLIMAINDIGFF